MHVDRELHAAALPHCRRARRLPILQLPLRALHKVCCSFSRTIFCLQPLNFLVPLCSGKPDWEQLLEIAKEASDISRIQGVAQATLLRFRSTCMASIALSTPLARNCIPVTRYHLFCTIADSQLLGNRNRQAEQHNADATGACSHQAAASG